MNKTTVVLLVIIAIFSAACDPAGGKWQEAKDADTIPAYEAFLEEYPESKYAGEAFKAIDDIAYQRAVSANTEDEFEAYIGNFSSGAHVDSARAQLRKLGLDRFVGSFNDHLLGFINGTESDIAALQGKPWAELDLSRGLKSGGFDIYGGRPVIRENSQMVFEDSEKQFQIVGTTIAEPQYPQFAKLTKVDESTFEKGVQLSLTSGETLQYDGDAWIHVDPESAPPSDSP